MSEYITEFYGSTNGNVSTERREEIVRCRDCRFRREYKTLNEVECLLCDDTTFEPKPDGFCAWGEKVVSE